MKKLQKIKAVFFDFDDTLGDREKYAYDCARDILIENSDVKDSLLLESMVQDWMLWDEKGNIDKNHVANMLKQKYNIAIDCENLNTYWDERLWKYTIPFPDAEYTLEQLQKKHKLGLITNGPSDGQRHKLERSGLSRFFNDQTITVSGDYTFKKPDIRIFQAAMQKMNVKPEECVYVGDIFANDITGSLRAGMKAVWIWSQGDRKCGIDIPIIHHISELLELL